jgi:uncharacterized repeat protein (TIGR03803 family)
MHGGYKMRREKGLLRGLLLGISVFIFMAWALGDPSAAHSQSAFFTLYNFGNGANDGFNPWGSLTLSGSTFYGMTKEGGSASNYGTIFQINTDGTGYKILHAFNGGTSDGARPQGSLTLSGSKLYGTTVNGGSTGNYGTIFQKNTDDTGYQVLHSFAGYPNDGSIPYGSLTLWKSTLYGMTNVGGTAAAGDNGTIFQINTDGTGYKTLYSFNGGSDGAQPQGSLTLSGSTLYGMTYGGGADSVGTIFQINTDGTGYETLYHFGGGSDGANPCGSLTLSGSTLYGMTYAGGASSGGTIFQINTDGTGYRILHAFSGGASDGALPAGDLTQSGSTLYGMTDSGGASSAGTIFQINTDGTGFQVLHSFYAEPSASLTLLGSALYGMTAYGGTPGPGTIFYQGFGSLTVTISPPGAVIAGAMWSVDGEAWQASGATVSNLSVGPHTVAFSGVQGWTAPPSQTANISYGVPASAIGTYTPFFAAIFNASITSGKAPLKVHFTNCSAGSFTKWLWHFGDGQTSKIWNPNHTYRKAGTYTVTLCMTGAKGTCTCTQPGLITVYAAPKAHFSAAPGSGDAPLTVNFTNESTGIVTSWLWNFGDGITSTDPNPTHTYDSPRTYKAKLTVYGPGGAGSKTMSITVKK